MAIDSQADPQVSANPASVIENEIPAYRAVSATAVTSLILGFCSVFCFTSLWFLVVVVAAILFGVKALASIRQLPDILTGSKIATTGIGLSLVFGISAVAQVVTQELVLTSQSTAFAKRYVDVIKSEPIDMAVWYMQTPEYRKERTPAQVVEEMTASKNPGPEGGTVFTAQTIQLRAIKQRLAQPNQSIHFVTIENKLVDGLTHYANALVDLDGPATPDFPDKEQFALIELMKAPGAGPGDWRVREIRYPYTPASAGVQAEHKDDGHGHSH